ncbi:MAG TPA: asparagine synthase (glutamine-hydrolyzing), partial [Armatimonadota bacterium]
PDAEGFHLQGRVGLGHRRLKIIDLEGGRQPMSNEDGAVWVTFNGEIYNYQALKAQLEGAGHRFVSRSDTEVLVHGYEEWGEELLPRLQGMFAFGVWDSRRERLLLARDRMGKKPLHYALVGGELVFASEAKALLEHPGVSRDLDLASLSRYLCFEYVPNPHSIYRDIRKLPPSGCLVWDGAGEPHVSTYWDLMPDPERGATLPDMADRLLRTLSDAVEARLMSDVPLGVFLSGGIDSSAITYFMTQLMPAREVKTFCIGFREQSFDESSWARRIATTFGTDHRQEVLDPGTLLSVLPVVVDQMDEPFADPSVIPTYLLSRFCRRHVTVALGGDGGDELFAGYDTFPALRLADLAERLPSPVLNAMRWAADRLPVSDRNMSLDFLARRFLGGLGGGDGAARQQRWLGAFSPTHLDSLLAPEALEGSAGDHPYDVLEALDPTSHGATSLQRTIYQYCRTYLTDDILVKVDRASMACSLEVRAPFLDSKVVELSLRMPDSLKLRGLRTKAILKHALRGKVPTEVLERRKKGFGIPVSRWLKGELNPLLQEQLGADKLRRQGLFNVEEVRRLVGEHCEGRVNHAKPLWLLLMFQLWQERHGIAS